MPATWNLRGFLSERGITSASEFRRIVHARTGYALSNQAVCDLLKSQPKMVRLKTSQAICDTFYCRLSDFLEVKPQATSRSTRKRPCLQNPVNSKADSNKKARVGFEDNEALRVPSENSNIDFAGLFPNARTFSTEPPIED